MKKQNISLFLGAVMATTVAASAQLTAPLDLDILFTGSAMSSASGNAAVEPDTLAVSPDGNTLYLFDSQSGIDQIYSYNLASPPVTTGTSFATEADLAGGNASAGDMTSDANAVYSSNFNGTKQIIWRIPYAGFGSAVQLVDSTGTVTVNMDEIAVDSKNSRLAISYNDAFSAATENIVTIPLAAVNGTPTTLATETDLETALAGIAGYVDDTADDLNIADMTVQTDGDVIVSHGFSSNRQINGSLLRVTETGTISVFRTADAIITAAGADPGTVDIGSVSVSAIPASAGASSQDQIVIFVPFSSATGVLAPFVAVVSADGTSQRQIATDAQLLGHLPSGEATALTNTGTTFFRFDSKSTIALDANGDAYFYRQAASSSTDLTANAVLKLSGIVASPVRDWTSY
ncbi:hypothetical protein GC173_13745 [bacterium]|nr:hypothetical protein [bacterium]